VALVLAALADASAANRPSEQYLAAVADVHKRAQTQVLSQLQYSDDLVCTGAALHGPVTKRATGRDIPLMQSDAPANERMQQEGIPIYTGIQVGWAEGAGCL